MIDRLAMTAGIPKPKVAVADMSVPNAFATGRSQKHAAVAVTTGLLRILNERELEGVLAHEISHIASRDVQVMTYASFLSVVASTLMSLFFWSALFGGGFGRSRSGGGRLHHDCLPRHHPRLGHQPGAHRYALALPGVRG